MTTGTGLAVLGMWITVAAVWHAPSVPGRIAWVVTIGVSIATYFIK